MGTVKFWTNIVLIVTLVGIYGIMIYDIVKETVNIPKERKMVDKDLMDLSEAIKHCEEKAEELRRDSQKHNIWVAEQCLKCAEEHEQLAEWLRELNRLRMTMELIKKNYILVQKGAQHSPDDLIIGRVMGDKEE